MLAGKYLCTSSTRPRPRSAPCHVGTQGVVARKTRNHRPSAGMVSPVPAPTDRRAPGVYQAGYRSLVHRTWGKRT
eukprot:3232884-Rhodomonas_salina.1